MELKPVLQRNMMARGTFGDAIRRSALRIPNKPMIIYYDHKGERHVYTYKDINVRANRFAHALMKSGVVKGDRVAVMSHNVPEFVMSWFGCAKIGAVITSVNFSYKADEVVYQINHSEPKVFVVEDSLIPLVETIRSKLISVKKYIGVNLKGGKLPDGWTDFARTMECSAEEPTVEIDDTDLAMLIYTSGTEARPKGVMLQYRNYLSATIPAWIRDVRMEEKDVFLYYMPFYTIAGLGSFTTCAIVGSTMILSYNIVPDAALKMITREKVTVIAQTPAFYIKLSQTPGYAESDFSTLTKCLVYGGLIPRGMVEAWRKKAPQMTWMTYWGQSELSQLGSTGWFKTIDEIPEQDPSWIGKPVFTLETKVLGPDGAEIEEGVGELLCRGACVMVGYYKDPGKTEEVMRDGWIHTGDIVRRDKEWNMFFFDRSKDVIKTGGMNVSSFEIQDAIYKNPKVLDVAVIGLPDQYWSEIVAAFVVPKEGEDITEEEIIASCKENLTGYKVPKKVLFVKDLPRDSQGKILKRKLREVQTS